MQKGREVNEMVLGRWRLGGSRLGQAAGQCRAERAEERYQTFTQWLGKFPGLRVTVVQKASKNFWCSMISNTSPGKTASEAVAPMWWCIDLMPKLIMHPKQQASYVYL